MQHCSLQLLRRFIHGFHWLEDAILVVIFFLFIGLAFSQIFMRNFLGGGWIWADNALRIFVFWLAMWGAMIAGRNEKHLRIELAVHYLPKEWYRISLIICDFACAAISGTVAWYSLVFVRDEYEQGAVAFSAVPAWLCEAIIPLVFTLLALRYFSQSVLNIVRYDDDADSMESGT